MTAAPIRSLDMKRNRLRAAEAKWQAGERTPVVACNRLLAAAVLWNAGDQTLETQRSAQAAVCDALRLHDRREGKLHRQVAAMIASAIETTLAGKMHYLVTPWNVWRKETSPRRLSATVEHRRAFVEYVEGARAGLVDDGHPFKTARDTFTPKAWAGDLKSTFRRWFQQERPLSVRTPAQIIDEFMPMAREALCDSVRGPEIPIDARREVSVRRSRRLPIAEESVIRYTIKSTNSDVLAKAREFAGQYLKDRLVNYGREWASRHSPHARKVNTSNS